VPTFGGLPDARRGSGAALATIGANSMMPVQRRPYRLFSTSSCGSGIISTIWRAFITPSTRDRTYPSVGLSVTFWKRSRGSVDRARTRSGLPSAARTTSGFWRRRTVSRIISPVDSFRVGSAWKAASGDSSMSYSPLFHENTLRSTSRT
jgi:hypothetical protein